MSYTEDTLALAAYEAVRARVPGAPASLLPRIRALVPAALERLGRLSRVGDYEGLQKSFSITIAAGRTDLKDVAGLLFDPLKSIVYPPSSATPAVWMPTVEDLVWGGMNTGVGEPAYYAQDGTALVFRNNADGLLTSLSGTGSVTTNYVPSLTDVARPLPAQYEGLLLETLIEVVTGNVNAAESAQTGRA